MIPNCIDHLTEKISCAVPSHTGAHLSRVEIMLKTSPKRALLTSNIKLTDSDGKSLRLLGFARLLHDAGCRVTLVVSECSSTAAKRYSLIETKAPLRDILLYGPLKRLLHFFRQSIRLLSFYAKLLILGANYDIVVTSLVGPDTDSLLVCILSKIWRVPFVYDYDDPSPELRIAFFGCSANDPRVRLSLFTRNILVKHATLVTTAADTVRHQIIEDSRKAKRVYVWYNLPRMDHIRVSEDKEFLRQKLGLEPNSFIVSYLGRVPSWGIEPLKKILVDFAENFRHDENVLFLIIGGGRWEEYYHKIIKNLRLTDRILITGMNPRQNALEYLMASNVSCIPFGSSLASSHIVPTKLFESMALGIPVLCVQSTNYVRILGDDGIYFDGSRSDLSKKIRWCLVNQKKLDKISSDLKLRFLREYTWEKRSLVLENVFRSLLQAPAKAA